MIETKQLTKRYGKKMVALDHLTLEIEKGTLFGFIGPNGAGKSTTMLILATLMAPTSGSALVGGYDVLQYPREVRRLVGYMPDFFGVYDSLKAWEYLDFYGANFDIPVRERKAIIPKLLELVNLSHKRDAFVDGLSRGMKQRLGLARALVHNPEVLILDEPASGLDPRARVEFREILKELRSMGKTILISSHILTELGELCDSIGVIEEGKLLMKGNMNDIYAKMRGQKQLTIRLLHQEEALVERLNEHALITDVSRHESVVTAGFSGSDEDQLALLQTLIGEGYPIIAFDETEENLEQIFMEITQGVGS